MKLSNKIGRYGVAACVLACALPSVAMAASTQSLGGMAQGGSNQMQALGNLAIQIAFFVGIILCGWGIMEMIKASKPNSQETYMQGLWKIIGGGGMAALPSITGVGIGTLFYNGGNAAATMTNATFN